MNFKKMSSGNIKRFVLFCLLSLFAICSPVVFAQEENRQFTSFEKSQSAFAVVDSSDSTSHEFSRRESEKHGVIDISDSKEIDETNKFIVKVKDFYAPKTDSDEIKGFLSSKHLCATFITEPKIDSKINARREAEFSKSKKANFPFALQTDPAGKSAKISTDNPPDSAAQNGVIDEGFRWKSALQQTLLFLAVQHGYAFTQPKTRDALKGKFFRDYVESVKSLHGWDDGGRFFTNYIAHPMQGSFVGFIQIQNDPKGMKQRFGSSPDYWRSRLKAAAWTAAWSTQFEIGPISQASIGNVGLKGKQTWEDIVVTPTLGMMMLIGEDALDRYVIERIERASDNYYLMIFSRTLLNPTRTVANLIRFKLPWHRDRPRAK